MRDMLASLRRVLGRPQLAREKVRPNLRTQPAAAKLPGAGDAAARHGRAWWRQSRGLPAADRPLVRSLHMRTLRIALTGVIATLGLAASVSVAQAKPSLTLTLPAQADAGTPASFSWTATRAVSRGTLVVQRQVGTARVWRTIRKLSGKSGSGTLPPLALGSYQWRIANIGPGPRRKLAAERRRTLRVFGKVPLATLIGGGLTTKTLSLPTTTFPYVLELKSYGGVEMPLTSTRSVCRSLHLDLAGGDAGEGASGTVTLVQETDDPKAATVPRLAMATLGSPLALDRSWSVRVVQDQAGGGSIAMSFYFNGFASCYSSAALKP